MSQSVFASEAARTMSFVTGLVLVALGSLLGGGWLVLVAIGAFPIVRSSPWNRSRCQCRG